MNIDNFLQRIDYKGHIEQSISCLTKLQEQFFKTIPFENLNIIDNIPLNYSSEATYEKIVLDNRGGVCYETNSLFYWALSALNFKVQIIAAEMFPSQELKNNFDHMALIVFLDNNIYLVDVGNGKYFGTPINLTNYGKSSGEGIFYKIVDYNKDYLSLYAYKKGKWKHRYAFNLEPKSLSYFNLACKNTETSAESIFNKTRLISLFKQEYRITLSANTLVKTYYQMNLKV